MGLLKGELLQEGLKRDLPSTTFEACRIPFASVSVNLTTRSRHVDTRGDLSEAITASAAFPIFFAPVARESGDHWDGGIVDKTPISALLALEKLDAVIVHYLPPSSLRKPDGFHLQGAFSGWKALDACIDVARHRDTLHQIALASARGVDVYICAPRLPQIGPTSMHKAPRAMAAARRKALAPGGFIKIAAGTTLDF